MNISRKGVILIILAGIIIVFLGLFWYFGKRDQETEKALEETKPTPSLTQEQKKQILERLSSPSPELTPKPLTSKENKQKEQVLKSLEAPTTPKTILSEEEKRQILESLGGR